MEKTWVETGDTDAQWLPVYEIDASQVERLIDDCPGLEYYIVAKDSSCGKSSLEATFKSSGGPFGQEHARFRFVLRRLTSVEGVSSHDNAGRT